MAYTMPACLVVTTAGAPAANSAVYFYGKDGTTAITAYMPGTTTVVSAPKTGANGMVGPFDFNVEWGYIKCGSALQPFATTASWNARSASATDLAALITADTSPSGGGTVGTASTTDFAAMITN